MSGDPDAPVAERALSRDLPDEVDRVAHEVADPALGEYQRERDKAFERERAVAAKLASARTEKQRVEAQADPELRRSPYSSADRTQGTGAPLFMLVDFQASVPERDRAGIEAALEASGLLAAWMSADGTLLAADTREVVLRGASPVAGASLSDVLRPVPCRGVSEAALYRVLRCVGLVPGIGEGDGGEPADPAARTWIAGDGRYRLDVLRGAHGKDRAEYIGAGVRAATRQRRIDELTEQIAQLEPELDDLVATRQEIEGRREALAVALREVPKGRGLTIAWSDYDNAISEVRRLAEELLAARREAEKVTSEAVSLRTRAQAQATSDDLPADREQLGVVTSALGDLRRDLGAMGTSAGRVLASLTSHTDTRTFWEKARRVRMDAESGYAAARERLTTAQRTLEVLEQSVGATEQDILARESDAQGRLDAAERGLPGRGRRATRCTTNG
jgi:chromosome segregation ATPase